MKEQKKEFVTTEMLLARKGLINKKPDPFFSNVLPRSVCKSSIINPNRRQVTRGIRRRLVAKVLSSFV